MPFVAPFPGGGKVTRFYRQLLSSGVSSSSFNFGGVTFGDEEAKRLIVCVGRNNIQGLTSCTIGGVAASILLNVGNVNVKSWIAAAEAPIGTSGTILFGFSGATVMAAAVYSLYGASALTPFATGSDTSNPLAAALNVPANGVVLAGAGDAIAGASSSWANVTEDVDVIWAGSSQISAASAEVEGEQVGLNVQATQSPVSTPAFVAAAWGP